MNIAVYRCRLCGEIYDRTMPGSLSEGRLAIEDASKGEPFKRYAWHARLIGMHACNVADTGLADLQGIKWVAKEDAGV